LEDFTQEEKTNLLNQISIAESYEYLCLFLIKFCNNFLIKITNSQLNYSKNGLIYNYEIIKDKIGKEVADKFDNIRINIGNSNKIEAILFNYNDSGNLKNDLESISNILLELSSVSEIEEVPLKELGKGLPNIFNLMKKSRNSISPMLNMTKYRMDTAIQAAGTFKNKRLRNINKTINNKIKNKKTSIKKRKNKIKRNTRKA